MWLSLNTEKSMHKGWNSNEKHYYRKLLLMSKWIKKKKINFLWNNSAHSNHALVATKKGFEKYSKCD